MVTPGLFYVDSVNAEFQRVDVHGCLMDKAVIFEGNYGVRSAFFRLAEGQIIERHTHTKWVQVFVIRGVIRVDQEHADVIDVGSGAAYFLNPYYPHTETVLEEALVLVTQGEDRPGWLQQ